MIKACFLMIYVGLVCTNELLSQKNCHTVHASSEDQDQIVQISCFSKVHLTSS